MSRWISRRPSEEDAIQSRAAAWLAQRDDGLTEVEAAEFARWQKEDPRHAAAVACLASTWKALQQLREFRPEARAHPDRDLLAPRPRRRRSRWGLALAGIAALAAVALALLSGLPFAPGANPGKDAERTLATTEDGYQRTTLPDGSVLELNASSEVQIAYTATERRLRLVRGEAHFTVAKNQPRPFVVAAGALNVKAVGTAFNVRLRAAAAEVLVTEGRVELDRASPGLPAGNDTATIPEPPAPPPLLLAGQRAVVALEAQAPGEAPLAVQTVPAEVMREELAWQGPRLVFVETPLAEVVRQFNRRNQVQLVIADRELDGLPVGGSFRPENVEAFVRLLANENAIAIERSGSDSIVLRRNR